MRVWWSLLSLCGCWRLTWWRQAAAGMMAAVAMYTLDLGQVKGGFSRKDNFYDKLNTKLHLRLETPALHHFLTTSTGFSPRCPDGPTWAAAIGCGAA
jgi:hypothetical protein